MKFLQNTKNGQINIIRFEKSDYTILFFLNQYFIYQIHRQDNLNNLKIG